MLLLHRRPWTILWSSCCSSAATSTRGTSSAPQRSSAAGPSFSFSVLGVSHVTLMIELRLALVSYQDYHMLFYPRSQAARHQSRLVRLPRPGAPREAIVAPLPRRRAAGAWRSPLSPPVSIRLCGAVHGQRPGPIPGHSAAAVRALKSSQWPTGSEVRPKRLFRRAGRRRAGAADGAGAARGQHAQ